MICCLHDSRNNQINHWDATILVRRGRAFILGIKAVKKQIPWSIGLISLAARKEREEATVGREGQDSEIAVIFRVARALNREPKRE